MYIFKLCIALRRYDVFRFAQNDVARFTRNDAMFAHMCPSSQGELIGTTSFAKRTSLGVAVIICQRQTSFKKRTFVSRQKCVFCWQGQKDLNPRHPVLETGVLPTELYPYIYSFSIITYKNRFCNSFFLNFYIFLFLYFYLSLTIHPNLW